MAWYFLVGTLAAFGALCALWVSFGWLLSACRDGCLVYFGQRGKPGFVGIYLWLRDLGAVRCPLIVVDWGFTEAEREYLDQHGIERYSLAELPERLGIGANTN